MAYAEGRVYLDADSHVMELPGWLESYADPGVRDRIQPLRLGGAGAFADQAVAAAVARKGDADAARALEDKVMTAKGWGGLGAFDRDERSRALDLLGFDRQLVFSTFAPDQFLGADDPDVLFGGATAHNRAMAEFCADDDRLLPVGFVPWGPPDRTAAATVEAIDLGAAAVLVASAPPSANLSPTHPDYDDVWRTLEERDVPFVVHVGGGGRLVRPVFHRNGKVVTDFIGGGENVRSKDYMAIFHPPEIFLSAMVLDGVLDRHPGLRGGCIEQGALWVVPWLKRLELAQRTFRRTEPDLALPLPITDYVHRQLWFTPFPSEPVGWLIEQAGDDLFLFSSDFPHPEGGRDPLARFEETMEGIDDQARERFYSGNFADLLGSRISS
jgi:predicted TIM-barrel fold metal-dependent hydrolase